MPLNPLQAKRRLRIIMVRMGNTPSMSMERSRVMVLGTGLRVVETKWSRNSGCTGRVMVVLDRLVMDGLASDEGYKGTQMYTVVIYDSSSRQSHCAFNLH